jgi:ubiquitin-protein ligase
LFFRLSPDTSVAEFADVGPAMIDFSCPQCRAAFSVAENLAGRRAKCKSCGTGLVVPQPPQPPSSVMVDDLPPPPKVPMRTRRLRADAEQIARAFKDFPPIKVVSATGDPPDRYVLEYAVHGLERLPGRKEPVPRDFHQAQIVLGMDYPRLSPQCKMLTPIFHPNIEPATICVGDHWTAGERLVDLAVRIAELIAYQAYNIKSPLDAEAAMWADLNMTKLPTDPRSMTPPEMD